jgi:hypothetical protein
VSHRVGEKFKIFLGREQQVEEVAEDTAAGLGGGRDLADRPGVDLMGQFRSKFTSKTFQKSLIIYLSQVNTMTMQIKF